jgi:hypothetical protein
METLKKYWWAVLALVILIFTMGGSKKARKRTKRTYKRTSSRMRSMSRRMSNSRRRMSKRNRY